MRTRFAPSPTGSLHVGGARAAILNWLLARHHGGSFVLRIEDTDLERNVTGAEQGILDDLRWLGLNWDEGPEVGGDFGPYRQSERADVYREHLERLVAQGAAFYCTCPPAPAESTGKRRARCACADRTAAPAPPEGASVRFRVPERGEIVLSDEVRGEITFPADSIEDFVLVRSDGRPTYNFAATVDDASMEITHVVRGADHLANTPKQILLYEAFGWDLPRFAHIPLILGADRQKLSKRHGATSVAEHRRQGFLPEALVNYLSLLSWSSATGDEVLSRERLIEEVDLERVGSSDAIFDRDKLRWLSGEYIQQLPLDRLVERLDAFIDRERFPIDAARLPTAVAAVRDHLSVLSEINDHLGAFVGPSTEEQQAARAAVLADPEARPVLEAVGAHLAGLDAWEEGAIKEAIRAAGKAAGARGRSLFHPIRVVLTGEDRGPELVKVVFVLGRERVVDLLTA